MTTRPKLKAAEIKAAVDSYQRVELRCRVIDLAIRAGAASTPDALISAAVRIETWLRTGVQAGPEGEGK